MTNFPAMSALRMLSYRAPILTFSCKSFLFRVDVESASFCPFGTVCVASALSLRRWLSSATVAVARSLGAPSLMGARIVFGTEAVILPHEVCVRGRSNFTHEGM